MPYEDYRMDDFDIVTVGHFSIDLIKLPNRNNTKPTLGGSTTYVSLSASKLDAKVSVISRVGKDFSEKYVRFLKNKGVDLTGLKIDKNTFTTSFFLNYDLSGERELYLKHKAHPIEGNDLPSTLKSKAVHIAPIANEISTETINRLKTYDLTLSLDPQGLIRRFNKDGKTFLSSPEETDFLRGIDVVKASYNEAKTLTAQSDPIKMAKYIHQKGVKIILITRGAEPTLLSTENKMYFVPSAKPKTVVDTTGAGDVFIGAFLTMYVRDEDPLWCACIGSAASSFVVEKYGPAGFGSMKHVKTRASQVYNDAYIVA
ncbi:carbohydrate kinase family protein [Candidatus Bathyarchaeota archaeon]|nr:carbohydrate kinase family protein [Candidatus Bathyarchaeota archaeon]